MSSIDFYFSLVYIQKYALIRVSSTLRISNP